jgi:hypothetical protein
LFEQAKTTNNKEEEKKDWQWLIHLN